MAALHANEFLVPRDFKFAFTSAQKAGEACPVAPSAAADAWEAISHDEVEVASSGHWILWTKHRRGGSSQSTVHRVDRRPPRTLWRGFHTRKALADQAPANDSARRRSAAKDALHVALSWKGRGRLAREWCALPPATRRIDGSTCGSHASPAPGQAPAGLLCTPGSIGVHGACKWEGVPLSLVRPPL